MSDSIASPSRAPDPSDERALASVGMQFFVNGAVFASFVPRLPELRDRFDVDLGALGATLTLGAAVGVIGSALAPRLIERVGSRQALLLGAVVLIAMLPIIGFAPSLVVFGLALAVMHAVDVVVDVAMNLQGSWLSARRRVPVMNRLHGLWSLGTVIGGVAAAQLAGATVSLKLHLSIAAAVLGIALVFVGRGLLRVDEAEVEAAPDSPQGQTRTMALVLIGLAGAFAIGVEMISSDWASFRLRDDLETSIGFAGFGYVAYTGGMTVGRFGGDWALGALGQRRLIRIAIVVAAVGMAAASFVPNRWMVLAAYALAGLGNSTMFPMLYDQAAQLPGARGAGLGALTAGSRVMFLIAPVLIGSLAATSLSVGAAVAVITLPSVVGFAFVVLRDPRNA